MARQSETLYGTYRCPVCGHRDGAEVGVSEPHRLISCSYCETPLEISSRGADSVRLAVQVADQSLMR